tara:strand:- start:1682 stop:2119 length:438 start_codon:yes stop_codon:yes gene_type:complete
MKDLAWWALAAFVAAMALHTYNAKAETAVVLGGWSEHLITDEDYNESHDAVLLEHDQYMVGRFNNSYGRESYVAAYGWTKQWGNWRGSVHAGVIKGYSKCFGDDGDSGRVCPMVYPAVTYTKYRVQPQVGLLGEAVVFTVRVRLF